MRSPCLTIMFYEPSVKINPVLCTQDLIRMCLYVCQYVCVSYFFFCLHISPLVLIFFLFLFQWCCLLKCLSVFLWLLLSQCVGNFHTCLDQLLRSVGKRKMVGHFFFFLVGRLAMHMIKPYWKIPFILKGKQGSTRQLSSMVIRLAGIVISLELYTKNKRDMTPPMHQGDPCCSKEWLPKALVESVLYQSPKGEVSFLQVYL